MRAEHQVPLSFTRVYRRVTGRQLIRNDIDLTWEILGPRRVKGGVLRASMNFVVESVLDALDHGQELSLFYGSKLSKKWMAGDKSARKEVEAALDKRGCPPHVGQCRSAPK
jgi:hypothetical protein